MVYFRSWAENVQSKLLTSCAKKQRSAQNLVGCVDGHRSQNEVIPIGHIWESLSIKNENDGVRL